MKQITKFIFMAFAIALMTTACAPQEFDDFNMGDSYSISPDKISFEMTPGSDVWTFDFTASIDVNGEKYPFSYEIRFGDGKTTKNLNGTHEYIVAKGDYIAQLFVFTPNGEVIIKDKTITITEDNDGIYMDDPNSLQYILTGGKDNVAGKTWFIGAWSGMRSPDLAENWWNFNGPDASMMNDQMTFTPNSINPNGGYIYDGDGDTFVNESAAGLFADGDPAGSFVTVNYTPAVNATWDITTGEDGKTYLTIHNGFIGYITSPEDLTEAKYEVYEYSSSSIKLIRLVGETNWCFELTNDAPADPLFGESSKTWVVDGNNLHLEEVKAALPDEPNIKGFMGLGPVGGNQEWWGAGAGDKSYETTLAAGGHGWTLYDTKYTFSAGGTLTIETAGEGYGRKAFDGQNGFNSSLIQGDDMLFPYEGGEYTFTKTDTGLTISDNGYLIYYAGSQDYEILYLSETAMCVRVTNTLEGQVWVFILCPEGEQ